MMRRALLTGGASALAAACTPLVQAVGRPGPGWAGPRLEADALVSFDGTRLPLSTWPAASRTEPWAVVVGLHGMNDYGAAFGLAGTHWAQAGVTTYAFDQRGFGRSPNRGVWGGESAMADDLRTACALVRARHPGVLLAVVGESMGGAVAIAAASSDRPPDCDRLVLDSPAVWGWGAQPPLNAAALWLMAHVAPGRTLTAPAWLARRIRASDNQDELHRMGRDHAMIFSTRADATYGLVNLMQTARERVGRVAAPGRALYLYGAHDDLIPKTAAFPAAAALARAGGRTAYYETGYHLLTRDLQRARVLDDVLAFIRDPVAPLPSGAPAVPAPGRRPRLPGRGRSATGPRPPAPTSAPPP